MTLRRYLLAFLASAIVTGGLGGLVQQAAAAESLVPNGGFEQLAANGTDPASWIKLRWGGNKAKFDLTSLGTGRAGRVVVTDYVSGDVKWKFAPVKVKAGVKYSYAESYSANVPSWIVSQYVMSDGSVKYGTLARPMARSNFGPIQPIVFLPPVGAVTMNVFHLLNTDGTLIIDDVSLTEVAPLPPNPVPNGSLETASSNPAVPKSWHYGSYGDNQRSFAYPVAGSGGGRAAEVSITKYVSGDAKWYYDFVPVSAGEEYRLAQKYRSDAPTIVSAEFKRADGSTRTAVLTRLASSGGAWRSFTTTLLVPKDAVGVTTFQSLVGVGKLAIDDVTLARIPSGTFSEGMVSFAFDDNLQSQRDEAVPRLNAAGLDASFLAVSNRINNPAALSAAELRAFMNAGHEIGSHTRTHAHLYGLSSTQLKNEIAGSKQDIASFGLRPNVTIAYPFGEYDEVIKEATRAAGYAGARSSDVGYNTRNTDPYALKGQHVEYNVSVETMKGWIDTAIADKTWLILEMHEVKTNAGKYAITPADFQTIIDYVKAKKMKNVTLEQGVRMMTGG